MKKVIVISTSLRRGSNSDMLADQFAEGAKTAGNEVEKISLVGKNIQFCKGCFGCQKLGRCVINDDVNDHGKSAEGRCRLLGYTYLLL